MFFIPENPALFFFFFFQAEDGIRDYKVTGVQTCALPIFARRIGTRVRVKTARPVAGSRSLHGTIVEAGADEVRLATDEGERAVPYDAITSARTEVDWEQELRRGRRRQGAKAEAEG